MSFITSNGSQALFNLNTFKRPKVYKGMLFLCLLISLIAVQDS